MEITSEPRFVQPQLHIAIHKYRVPSSVLCVCTVTFAFLVVVDLLQRLDGTFVLPIDLSLE